MTLVHFSFKIQDWGPVPEVTRPSPPLQYVCSRHSPRPDTGEVMAAAAWTEIWGSGWTFEADLFGKQSIKGFHYSVQQRGHSLSLYNGILIHMHLLWQGTKSIVWQACSLLPGINNSLRNTVRIDSLSRRRLSVAALCWSAHSVIVALKTQSIPQVLYIWEQPCVKRSSHYHYTLLYGI